VACDTFTSSPSPFPSLGEGGNAMDVYVGTSGWYYRWNKEKSLDWFLAHSGLNTVELNASFYRFPFPNQIDSWAKKGKDLSWAIKVNRAVTHTHRFNDRAFEIWGSFRDAFSPLDEVIDYYLFQAPPQFNDLERLIGFIEKADLGGRCAVEIRNKEILGDEAACGRIREHAVLVSVDSPDFTNRIVPGDHIYLRMHGRNGWYAHDYSGDELTETADIIRSLHPGRVHCYFNNNHAMLKNARAMREILEEQ
jgi:uncharacterized protein YecE (DUF72 family)